jgi:hypothetical protein
MYIQTNTNETNMQVFLFQYNTERGGVLETPSTPSGYATELGIERTKDNSIKGQKICYTPTHAPTATIHIEFVHYLGNFNYLY